MSNSVDIDLIEFNFHELLRKVIQSYIYVYTNNQEIGSGQTVKALQLPSSLKK